MSQREGQRKLLKIFWGATLMLPLLAGNNNARVCASKGSNSALPLGCVSPWGEDPVPRQRRHAPNESLEEGKGQGRRKRRKLGPEIAGDMRRKKRGSSRSLGSVRGEVQKFLSLPFPFSLSLFNLFLGCLPNQVHTQP